MGFYSLVFLVKALATHNIGHEINLFALSNNVQEVFGTETLCPEKSTLLGPCIVIRQEYPNIRTKSIDLDLSGNVSEYESAADLVIGEFLDSDSSLFVAYRNAQRWVQTYESVALSNPGRGGSPFRERGVYLITGGLGKVGIAISEYLARNYGAKLVLVGRSSLPGRETWNARIGGDQADDPVHAKIRTIERLETLGGEVLYVNASVADVNAMRGAIEQTYQRFGVLHGVIHAAGIVGDNVYREIKDCNYDDCDGHFQAKAHGALVLEDLLDGKSLEFCLLLSSLTSVLGGIGQAAYAASNIYLDSFVRRHNRSHSVPWLSVNWDVWRIRDETAIDSGLGKTLRELGMSADEAMELLETVLAARNANQLIVSTGDLGARINQWINLESLNIGEHPATANPTRSTLSRRPSLQTDYDAPRDETEQRIAQIWQDALGIDEIGINDNFSRLGGHSLLAIRIVTDLRKAFQFDLPIRALFDAPTIAELSTYIKERIIAEIEALTDEEARLLVSNERHF
jgi:NAD(P)-dependent dehydrogenase (short-subunit alcohol dehydrogenase family)/acyl carrier protein